jgi:hypothetical protein
MAWTDHPQKFKGQLMIHRPRPLKSAQINGALSALYIGAVTYDNEVGRTFGDVVDTVQHENYCVLTFGAAREGRELGTVISARYNDSAANTTGVSEAPYGSRLGEFSAADDDFITWWEQYIPFFLSSRFYEDSGTIYYIKKGGLSFANIAISVANIGPGFFGFVGASGYADVGFDAEDSWLPSHMDSIYDTNWAGDQSATGRQCSRQRG